MLLFGLICICLGNFLVQPLMDQNFEVIKFYNLLKFLFRVYQVVYPRCYSICFLFCKPRAFCFPYYGVGISELQFVELYLRKIFSLHYTCNINLQCKHIKIVNIVCICKKCKIFTTFYKYV